jgi:hypothetical protein
MMNRFEISPANTPEATPNEERPLLTESELDALRFNIKNEFAGFRSRASITEMAVERYNAGKGGAPDTLKTIAHGMDGLVNLEERGVLDTARIPEGEEKTAKLVTKAQEELAAFRVARNGVIEKDPTAYRDLMTKILERLVEGRTRLRTSHYDAALTKGIGEDFEQLRMLGNVEFLQRGIEALTRALEKNATNSEALQSDIETLKQALVRAQEEALEKQRN